MLINVVDLEFHQFKGGSRVFEMGICALDSTRGAVIRADSVLFSLPDGCERMPRAISEMTGLTAGILSRGRTVPSAMAFLNENYNIERRPWVAFSSNDARVLEQNQIVMPKIYMDVQMLVQVCARLDSQPSLTVAMQVYGLEPNTNRHSAFADSIDTARLLCAMANVACAPSWPRALTADVA